jgi:hypothetical protein
MVGQYRAGLAVLDVVRHPLGERRMALQRSGPVLVDRHLAEH